MTTTQTFFSFLQDSFGIEPADEKDPLWSLITPAMDPENVFDSLVHFLTYTYPKYVRGEPRLALLLNDVFKATFAQGPALVGHDPESEWGHNACLLFDSWTMSGARDLSVDNALSISETLYEFFSSDEESYHNNALSMIARSPALWNIMGSWILDTAHNCREDIDHSMAYQRAIHRHAPHLTQFYDATYTGAFYAYMCAVDSQVKLHLHDMISIFTEQHNNANAWITALCMTVHPSTNDDWMKMLETFSALPLDLKDPNAWGFWKLLSDRTKSDASGRNLMVALSEAHPAIASAFADAWPMLDTLYEGNERYAQAVQMHNNNIFVSETLILPTL